MLFMKVVKLIVIYWVKFFKGCLPQILLAPFLDTLSQINCSNLVSFSISRLLHFLTSKLYLLKKYKNLLLVKFLSHMLPTSESLYICFYEQPSC